MKKEAFAETFRDDTLLAFKSQMYTMRSLLLLLCLVTVHAFAAGPTGTLNDTGVTQCYDGTQMTTCTNANAGDAGSFPGQDGRFGRDAAAAAGALTKVGGGAAGFDFTALDASGNPIALDGSGVPVSTPVCVRDNVTNLIWVADGAVNGSLTWGAAQAYATTYSLCGYASGWRLPTRRELLSIVNFGAYLPAIDTNFFPNIIQISPYWTSDITQFGFAYSLTVFFADGTASADHQTNPNQVRLVRSGP
ncbi:MAG: DUF1566 domain-containing protein [Curvibacter sp.]|nr:DUF1566 domain-containing protein [Curvibacter sp.]